MKNPKICRMSFLTLFLVGLSFFNFTNLFGQSENRYFDGETIGAKGTVDRKKDHFISTGATKIGCPEGGAAAGVFYAYLMETEPIGNMVAPATLIGDGVNDYYGKDVKTLDSGVYYVTGYTTKAQSFPGIYNSAQNTYTKYYNAFISLVDLNNPANDWIRVFGDSIYNDQGMAVVIDASRNACITGICNEKAPCVDGGGGIGCDSGCYPTGEVLLAIFNSNGNQLKTNRLNLSLSRWGIGNDIVYAFNKLFIAATVSNSTCGSGYKSNAEAISYDPMTNMYNAKKLQNDSGLSYTGNGLVNDQGNFIMVGDVVNYGKGYTWGFDQMLNPMFFDHFTDNQGKWGFKAILVDSICTVDTIHMLDTFIIVSGYMKNYAISGEEWNQGRIYSNMMALNVDPGVLPGPIIGRNYPYKKYVFEYSVNANLAFPPVSCMNNRTQVVDLGIFGHSYNNHISNHSAYIAAVTAQLGSGCDETYDYQINPRFFMDSVDYLDTTFLPVLDTIYASVNGLQRDPICEIVFSAPPINGNKNANPRKAETAKDQSKIQVFPNPAKESLEIKSEISLLNRSIELYDYSGRIVKSFKNQTDIRNLTLNIKDLQDGIYFLRIKDGQNSIVKKVEIRKM